MMRLKKRKNNGFSLIELMFSAVIVITVMTGATTAYIATIKENKAMEMAVLAQDILKRVLDKEVRNKPLMGASTIPSLCGDSATTGTLANKLVNATAPNFTTIDSSTAATALAPTSTLATDPIYTFWNREIYANTLVPLVFNQSTSTYLTDTNSDEYKVLSASRATVRLEIRPINVANPSGTPSYSESRVTVKLIFKWNNAGVSRQVETSTVDTYKGIFDKSLTLIK